MRLPPLLLMLALVGLATGCVLAPPFYWAREIRGRVVDADTGEAIEGAVVVADWKLYGGGMGHGGYRNSLRKDETLTDADGRFALPAWGPLRRPSYEILDDAPHIVIFRRTYEIATLRNRADSNGFVRRSDWNESTFRLRKFTGPVNMRVQGLQFLVWRGATPRLLQEIVSERRTRTDWPESADVFSHPEWLLKGAPR